MAHQIPAALWALYPDSSGDQLVFADSSTGDTKRIRLYVIGAAATDNQQDTVAITAQARTGAWIFGTPSPKHIRRVEATGRGNLLIGFAADLERSSGEVKSFVLPVADGPFWNTVNWNEFDWGPQGGVNTKSQWYSRRGRWFQITVRESSTVAASTEPRLGGGRVVSEKTALNNLLMRVIPLDAEA